MRYVFNKAPKKIRNSARQTVQGDNSLKNKTLPNSLVRRILQDQRAENEADRLSQGVTAATPDEIMREMGNRLGADFSDVQFHSDSLSMNRSQALGARAWAQGSDVYFGKGGFDPKVAAHELVHTVQQGAVEGNVSESVPMGTVQMLPARSAVKEQKFDNNTDFGLVMGQILSTEYGSRIYNAIEKDLFKLIKKGAGRNFRTCAKEDAIKFLALAAGQDYTGKTLMASLLKNSIESKDEALDRLYEYQEFIRFLSNRLREYDLETAAIGANVMADIPKYEHNNPDAKKRAYEMKVPGKASEDINFNPGNNPELQKVQNSIDEARNPQEAYRIFGQFTGNNSASYKEERNMRTDLPSLKIKLKNMARVVLDYPELRGQIGNMHAVDSASGPSASEGKSYYMAADSTLGGWQKAKIYYNSVFDIPEHENSSQSRDKRRDDDRQAGNDDFSGTHELGHVMASTLIDGGYRESTRQFNYSVPENEMLDKVLSNKEIMPEEDYKNLKRYSKAEAQKDDKKKFKNKDFILEGTIKTNKNMLHTDDYTSGYGATNAQEFFAEAVADVYTNGDKARKASIALVREYEKRQKILTRKKFFRKKAGIFRRLWNWINF